MDRAIAETLLVNKDVPVGAVIVKNGEVLASCHNMKEEINDVTAHAEILAIKKAQEVLKSWHLDGCEMYVTLEPCPMCGWAILQSRIDKLYFGSYDNQYGAFSVLNLKDIAKSNIQVYGGIKEEECDRLLNQFFRGIR